MSFTFNVRSDVIVVQVATFVSIFAIKFGFFFFFEDIIKEFTIKSDREVDQKGHIDAVRNKHPLEQLWLENMPHKPNKDSYRLLDVEFGLGVSRKEDQHVFGVVIVENPIEVNGLDFDPPFALAVLVIRFQDLLS